MKGQPLEDENQEVEGGVAGGALTEAEPMVTSTPAPTAQPLTTAETPTAQVAPSSTLIKVTTTPQGTPQHATFTGTQNYTPSTRISALNMVGDLLRKVGVSPRYSVNKLKQVTA